MKNLRFLLFALLLGCFYPVSLVSQTQVAPFLNSTIQLFNNSGQPCAGCLLSTFSAGTTTPLATYSESTGTTPNANPVVLDSAGRATIYLTNASYKFVLKTAAGATIFSQDVVTWNNLATTLSSLTLTGNATINSSTAATNVANQSGPTFCMDGNFWNGSASAVDSWCWNDVLGTGTNPTSTFTLVHSGSSGVPTASLPAVAMTSASISGALVAQRSLKVCDANTYAGATWDAQITAALADANCSTISGANLTPGTSAATVIISNNKRVILPCGTFVGGASVNPVIQVNNFGALLGFDRNCTVLSTNSGTANIIGVNNGVNWWRISDMTIQSAVARTAGAGIRVQGGHGVISNLIINPVFDGIFFDTASVSGLNVVRDVEITDGTGSPGPGSGAAWHCGLRNGGISSGTISGNTWSHVTIVMSTAFTDAGFCIQDGSDAIAINENSQAVANVGGSDSVSVHIETVNGGLQPTGTSITASAFEGGLTKTGIVIDAGFNTVISANTIQSSLKGILLNGGNSIRITGNQFHLNQEEGVKIAANVNPIIANNHFSMSSQETTNTFSDILAVVGATKFIVSGNTHIDQSSSGKVCKFGVEIAAGGSDFYAIRDDINNGNCGTAAISDGGTGVRREVCNPGGGCSSGLSVGLNGDLSASRNASSGVYFFGSTSVLLDFGVTTAGRFTFTGGPEQLNFPLISTGTAAALTGTGACATFTTQTGGSWAGRATCTAATGASTFIITPGVTVPNGWVCSAFDQTTRANLLQQTATSPTACTLTATSVTQNDVIVFSAVAF